MSAGLSFGKGDNSANFLWENLQKKMRKCGNKKNEIDSIDWSIPRTAVENSLNRFLLEFLTF
jgi:hypothetical protein